MAGAATLAAGNGMIEVTGNPLVAALYPEREDEAPQLVPRVLPDRHRRSAASSASCSRPTADRSRHWPYQIGVIYLPILVYGVMVLPQQFPKTENAEAGIPVGEMFRYTLTNPLFLLMLAMMAITTSTGARADALGARRAAGRRTARHPGAGLDQRMDGRAARARRTFRRTTRANRHAARSRRTSPDRACSC